MFPTAPTRPVTINGGVPMPAWFDLYHMARMATGDVDKEGISQAMVYLGSLVSEEVKAGIPTSRIVIGGFSQGGWAPPCFSIRHRCCRPIPCLKLISSS